MALDIAGLSGFRFVIPPEIMPFLPLGISRLPLVAPIGGHMVAVRETVRAMLADGDLDFADVLTAFAAVQSGGPIPPKVIIVPPQHPDAPDTEPDLVWPDAVSIKVNWAQEPGTDAEGQQVLVPVGATEGRDGLVIVGSTHPGVVNDRTKITFEAGVAYKGQGLHFSDHPHLVGSIEWIAEDQDGSVLGSIGGSGSSAPGFPRSENGIGWGGARYAQSGGTLGVASIKPELKGMSGIRFYARVRNAPGTPTSRVLRSELVV